MRLQASWRLTSAAALLALASAAATGVALAHSSGQSPIQQANANVYKAGTNRFVLSVTLAASGKQYTMGAKGAFDLRHERGAFTVDFGALLASLNLKIGGSAVPSKIDMVLTGNVVYMHVPQLAKQSPGKEWLKIDPKTLPKSTTGGADVSSILSSLSPQQVLTVLGGAQTVRSLGTQTLSGVPMAHYRTVIDANKLANAITASQRAQIRKLMKQLGLTAITADVWIDRAGYLRRIASAPLTLKTSATASVTGRLTMSFSAFGSKVVAVAPPAAKTLDFGKTLAGLGSGGGGTTTYQCTGNQLTLFNNGNIAAVQNGGTPPTFSTNGADYCLVSIATYHWNNAKGTAAPGTIALGVVQGLGGAGGTLGPWQTTGSPGQGGVPNAYWTATLPAGATPVVINGTYTCRDSSPATWAQNAGTGGHGICTVTVRKASKT
jgi:hypothetical protein